MPQIKFRQKTENGWHYWGFINNMFISPLINRSGNKEQSQQFTGLLDKNGKEIYNGDILNSLYKFEGCNGVYLVKWHDDSCGFYPKKFGTHQQKYVSVSMLDLQRCEVIGNIFENPELINK